MEGSGHCPGTFTCPHDGWSYCTGGELRTGVHDPIPWYARGREFGRGLLA
jgi:hypothetical protein